MQQQGGRYRPLRLIDNGGRYEVYLAEDLRVPQKVAIKVLRLTDGTDPRQSEARAKMARLLEHEARMMDQLRHPHILQLIDYCPQEYWGETAFAYMVVPFYKDGSFADWLALHHHGPGSLPFQDITRLLSQAADALQYVHDHQIIHQNVKPASFLIRAHKNYPNSPDLFLTNFSAAQFISAKADATSVRGTPAYMAPEQWNGHAVPASDQYALAAMAYELLTGELPFKGSQKQLEELHLSAQPGNPSRLNTRISSAVDAIILRALAKKPEERFPSIANFAAMLQQIPDRTPPLPIVSSPPKGYLHMTLPVTAAEAKAGAKHMLVLPNQQKFEITLPTDIRSGQTLCVDAAGRAVLLTLIIRRDDHFDVFLCHNGEDKPAVKKIGKTLKEYGIIPWLDEWELRPGQLWQPLLEQQIEQIKSAAVFVGQAGIGPWQQLELLAFLRELASHGCPVIPVLLPDAPTKPKLPLFLRAVTWVDFRKQDPDPMEQLIWGITGKHRTSKL